MSDITLTFDNGPEPETTPRVLDTLARNGVRSTFFVLGQKLADPARRALAARAVAEGHWIGNHTYSHDVPLGLRTEADVAEREIGRTQELIGELSHPARYFRPSGGGGNLDRRLLNQPVLDYLVRGRYSCILWNAVPRDWDDEEGWVDRALAQIAEQPWMLMVLHDIPGAAARHLERFIGLARDRGSRFRQDFPPACVPVDMGKIMRPMSQFITN